MSTRIEYVSFQSLDHDAKANYRILYERLPAPSTVEIESSTHPFQTIGNHGQESMLYFRLSIGHLIGSDTGPQLDKKVYAYVTMDKEGCSHVSYGPEAVSDTVDVQTGKVSWYAPFEDLDTSSKSAAIRSSRFQAVVLYYVLASGKVPLVRVDGVSFRATLKTVCWKLYKKEQIRQTQQQAEVFKQATAPENTKRPREHDDIAGAARAARGTSIFSRDEVDQNLTLQGPGITESRSFSSDSDHDTVCARHPGLRCIADEF
jgi:hypothetical protein